MTTSESNSTVSLDGSNSVGRSIYTNSTHQGSSSNSFNSGACSADGDTDNDGDSETPPRKFRSLREIHESCTLALYVSEPSSYEEAAERSEWRLAMEEEMSAIEKNET